MRRSLTPLLALLVALSLTLGTGSLLGLPFAGRLSAAPTEAAPPPPRLPAAESSAAGASTDGLAPDVSPLQPEPWAPASPLAATGWGVTRYPTPVWVELGSNAANPATLPQGSRLELLGASAGGRVKVRFPGDGLLPPVEAWVEAAALAPIDPPPETALPQGRRLGPALVRIHAPYRSQLDGSPWAQANCGPTVLGMGLAALGIDATSTELRRTVMRIQGFDGDDAGSFIWALAEAAKVYGARPQGLYDARGQQRRWTVEDIRGHLQAGRPVVVQVRFRALPGREEHPYGGDHYILLTGFSDDAFLYNDPIDSDGIGYDRVMTSAELTRAMNASDRRYAYAGFALSR